MIIWFKPWELKWEVTLGNLNFLPKEILFSGRTSLDPQMYVLTLCNLLTSLSKDCENPPFIWLIIKKHCLAQGMTIIISSYLVLCITLDSPKSLPSQ